MSKYAHWPNSLRKSFIKDHSIPISVVEAPYFGHQMELLDKQYKTSHKASMLNDALLVFPNIEDLHKHIRETRERIVDDIKNSDPYKEFQNRVMGFSQDTPNIPKDIKKSIYKPDCTGIDLVSLDLTEANFNILRTYKVLSEKTYRELVTKYTDLEYFIQSKKIRQVIFGNLNPKRQLACIRFLTKSMAEGLSKKFPNFEIASLSHDEVIFKMPDGEDLPNDEMDLLEEYVWFASSFPNPLHIRIEEFKLERLDIPKSPYVKRFPDGSYDLKCCPGNYTLEVIRYLNDEAPNLNDRVFNLDGRLATYAAPLFPLSFD
jgi:hypothetical protein